jgi:hypothetical protein
MQNLLLQAVSTSEAGLSILVRDCMWNLYLPRPAWLLTSQRKTLTWWGRVYHSLASAFKLDHIPEAFHVTATISNDRNGGSSFIQTHKLRG